MATVLYITYDGLMEPLGRSQVWQYAKYLSKKHEIIILSFEKSNDLSNYNILNQLKHDIELYGVHWKHLTYHKSPRLLATMYDIVHAIFFSVILAKKYNVDIIHARSYIPSMIALIMNKLLHIKYIFDMRGFWADEKIDSGVWRKDSTVYKIVKKLERYFFLNAHTIVSLTNAGKGDVESLDYIRSSNLNISVIPTCTNLSFFKPKYRLKKENIKIKKSGFILGYVGSVETFYLFDEVLKSFLALLSIDKNSKLLIINRNQHDYIRSRISKINIDKDSIELKSATYEDVAHEINRMDAGIFYIKPTFSKRSSSPTRMGEFLGCGKPCLSNIGVGDVESILSENDVGIVLDNFSSEGHIMAIKRLINLANDKDVYSRCVNTAKKYFSLDVGVENYNKIYSLIPSYKNLD